MSDVTNLILSISTYDDEQGKLKEVNTYFLARETKPLISVDDPILPKAWYGGSKFLECALSIGAFNHLDLDDFLDHLRSIQWRWPEQVQVIAKAQEALTFTIRDL
jgi:hypothetical protein